MFCSCYGASSIFLLSQSKPEKIALKHNKLVNSRKVMAYHLSLNGSAGGCFSAYAAKSSISPLTCTIFDPIYFGTILRNQISHISPTSLKKFIMGNYLTTSTSLLKSHTGATQALTRARERCFVCSDSKFVHLYCYFSVFGLWHKADFAHF